MKRKMLQFSAERAEMLDKIVLACGYPTEKKKMFGHEVHFLNGYMFTGANVDGIFVHLGEEAKDAALETESDVGPFKPIEGMTMKDYLLLEEPIVSDPNRLKQWLDRSSRYLLSRPPKVKKKKKKKIQPQTAK
jgi:TfoX/Sxy family transcriptional regulator of competence genes